MDDVELMRRIREDVKDVVLETVLIQLAILRNTMREISDQSVLVKAVSVVPLGKVDLDDLKRFMESVEDEELKKELGYLLNLAEDIKSGKLLKDLLYLSEIEERMCFLGYLSLIVAAFAALAYWFSFPKIKPLVLALAFIIFLACGYVFHRALLSKREILKNLTLRYKLK
jgi:hypothetical protein